VQHGPGVKPAALYPTLNDLGAAAQTLSKLIAQIAVHAMEQSKDVEKAHEEVLHRAIQQAEKILHGEEHADEAKQGTGSGSGGWLSWFGWGSSPNAVPTDAQGKSLKFDLVTSKLLQKRTGPPSGHA